MGFHFDLATIDEGDSVVDLGSGAGMDCFIAALAVRDLGHVTGIDMTDEQLDEARSLARNAAFGNVSFEKGFIESVSSEDGAFDVAISNGVINLASDKSAVFAEIHRLLKPGGRMAMRPSRVRGYASSR